MYRIMFYPGGNFVSSLICTLKSKKPNKRKKTFKKPKNFFLKTPGFFKPWVKVDIGYRCFCIRLISTPVHRDSLGVLYKQHATAMTHASFTVSL